MFCPTATEAPRHQYTRRVVQCVAPASSTAAMSRSGAGALIKVCGVMTPEDAEVAASAGADFIGMIMWQRAKRAVSLETARRIVQVARYHGAEPVGVFVDEDATTISHWCRATALNMAQLHGDGARAALPQLPSDLHSVYVMQSDANGQLQTQPPAVKPLDVERQEPRRPAWLLVDGIRPGSGEAFDWAGLRAPTEVATRGWLLAGGLEPANVADALHIACPTGVDVSSGVTYPDGLRKDPGKVLAFIEAVQGATCTA